MFEKEISTEDNLLIFLNFDLSLNPSPEERDFAE